MANSGKTVLGIDLGTNSIGWAILELDDAESPCRVIDVGVRIFPAGVEGNIDAGRDEPRNVARRQKRMTRRQLLRRQRRRRAVFRHLQAGGLLPKDVPARSVDIDGFLRKADSELTSAAGFEPSGRAMLPYLLRKAALDRDLTKRELGRALYHLSQRRGFRSNRKDMPKPDEKPGEVKASIQSLEGDIADSGARTIGEWFATIDPREIPLRRRWTGRAMYEHEFDLIRSRQAGAHSELTAGWWDRLKRLLFDQRPLKSQANLVGRCALEQDRRRTPLAMPLAQRFRILQTVNHLRIIEGVESRPLDPEQRQALIAALESKESVTIAAAKKAIGLPSRTPCQLSPEVGGEKKLPGNRTEAAISKALGKSWSSMPPNDRARLLNDLMSYEDEDALAARLAKAYGLTPEEAGKGAAIRLEPGHARHSDRALRRLVPHMEKGMSYSEARKAEYPDSFTGDEALESLPPLKANRRAGHEAAPGMADLRNPVVERSLTELRKIVNGIIRRHGKPDRIHVELGRDLKRSRKDRQALSKAMRQRGDERDAAANSLRRLNVTPTRDLIDRVLLAYECSDLEDLASLAFESSFRCPYTGRVFSMRDLVDGRVDVEHIIPFSRSLDDSFGNKTLCDPEFNRNRKGNRTPFECLSSSPEEYEEVLDRVRSFRGKSAPKKFRLFSIDKVDPGFAERQLQDTRYASRKAAEYLRLLYGSEGLSRVHTVSGTITGMTRRYWGLNAVLGRDDQKDRSDHRHHAVDAVVIAACTRPVVNQISRAAGRAEKMFLRELLADLQPPWPSMAEELQQRISGVVVSHRPSRSVNGGLHDETNYAPPGRGGGAPNAHVRKKIVTLKQSEVDKIVDPAVRESVQLWIEQHGFGALSKIDPAKPDQFPFMAAKDGRRIPIKKVRIKTSTRTVPVGTGHRRRFVAPNSNHHLAVFEVPDPKKDGVKWVGVICTRLEAMRRVAAKMPVVDRTPPSGGRFLFTLASGDMIEFDHEGVGRRVGVVSAVSESIIEWRTSIDGRTAMEIRKAGAAEGRFKRSVEGLRLSRVTRVHVDPLGNVVASCD